MNLRLPFSALRRQLRPGDAQRAGVRGVIEHLAAELLVMHQRNEGRLSAHDAARLLREGVQ